ncbi:coiled-coil domain-containing protein 151 isoform X3 [Salvelinus alpinus]|uniref:coiled-coil domain-containing protein 151 isoform X3 n=1 Tax=Salvelinus alpinus TaxID=8036 RepID=UPI0039FC26CD
MPFSAEAIKPPLHEQITELQRKIQLLEGDRSAYYEMSQSSIKKNRNSILQLRQENKRLHKKLANALAGDEQVIKEAFQSRGMEKAAFRNMSGKAALKVLDQKLCDKMKKLNALKHTTQTYRRRLEDLKTLYQSMKLENRGPERDTERRNEEAKSEGEAAEEHPQKNLRVLENRLEKAQLKCQEAEHIMRGYLKLKAHLQEESLTFQSQLDKLEAEILRQRQELKDLQVMNSDALLSKDTAKAELQRQEEQMYRERKDRECILTRYKKEAEDRKAQAERVERRAQRAALQPDELSSDAQRSATGLGEEERAISTFEEAFRRIKEATGVTDTREVVERFISQGDTQQHLEDLKKENQRTLLQLKEDRDRLQEHFQDIKYSGETKLSSGQQMLEDCKRHLQAEQGRRDAAKERLDWLTRTLNTVRAGVEHLSDKLQHIKLFHASIEGKLPHCNTRIKLPEAQRQDPYDEEESGDDEGDIITRAILKHQSQLIIDSKTKRKTRTKKKKGKL